MRIILPDHPSEHDWVAKIGISLEQSIEKLMRGGWFRTYGDHTVIEAFEAENTSFSLRFSDATPGLPRYGKSTPLFGVTFCHNNNRDEISIPVVMLSRHTFMGLTNKFLNALVSTAIEIGVSRIYTSPTASGAPYWASRGGILKTFPSQSELARRFKSLKSDSLIGWNPKDIVHIDRIIANADVDAFNNLMDRDDLQVRHLREGVPVSAPLRYGLMDQLSIDPVVFDLNDPRTKERLLKRVGVDVDAEFATRSEPAKPTPGFEKTNGPKRNELILV